MDERYGPCFATSLHLGTAWCVRGGYDRRSSQCCPPRSSAPDVPLAQGLGVVPQQFHRAVRPVLPTLGFDAVQPADGGLTESGEQPCDRRFRDTAHTAFRRDRPVEQRLVVGER